MFLGPKGLITNIKCYGKFKEPTFIKILKIAKGKVIKSRKFSGIIPKSNNYWKKPLDRGFNLITAGIKLTLLIDTKKITINEFKKNG